MDAALSGEPERFALQDADINGLAGRTIESRNSAAARAAGEVLYSRFEAVEIRPGVYMEVSTLDQYIRLGVLPPEVRTQAIPSQGWTWRPKNSS